MFQPAIEKILNENKPDFIFHAAAMHVEIVQDNPINLYTIM